MRVCSGLAALLGGAIAIAWALSGCAATRYQRAARDTPPPVLLKLAAVQTPAELALRSVIVYDGPGSWKREALWDEYVVTIHDRGQQPLTIDAAALVDFAGTSRAPGADPWKLEKESQTIEQRYQRAGVAMARGALPRVFLMGTGAAAGTTGGVATAAAAAAAAASLVALPVYYVVILGVDHAIKTTATAEFTRRRLVLPLTIAPGELRTGSLFFPMAPNPQSLALRWSSGAAHGDMELTLEALHGIHAGTATEADTPTPP